MRYTCLDVKSPDVNFLRKVMSGSRHDADKVAETRERMERPDIPGQPKTTERVIYELLKAEL